MGETRRYAEQMNLIEREPLEDLSTTGPRAGEPRRGVLVLEPNGDGRAVTVQLAAGRCSAEWFNLASRDVAAANATAVDATIAWSSPLGGRRVPRSCTSAGR